MSFDDKLTSRRGSGTKQAAEFCLGAGMQVHFRLLQEEHRRAIRSEQLHQYGKRLAYAVSHVDQIAFHSLDSLTELSYLKLKRSPFGGTEWLY